MGRWEPNARGRLEQAALELYGERGFEQTTVAEIAKRAGLTERTFFRHFADKREVLFWGAGSLEELLVGAVAGAPDSAAPIDAVVAGLEAAGALLQERRELRPSAPEHHRREHGAARTRADQARITRLGARRHVAPARRRRTSREPDRGGRHRRLQNRLRALGHRDPPARPAATHPRVAGAAESRNRRRMSLPVTRL